ncbi:MAG: PASTA domain-containing protein [Elusimicrobia bacterium]|nr:PASTA domain-containing protein [Elusimicrobiota bacterium]
MIRAWEACVAFFVAAAAAYYLFQWGLAGVIHSRKIQTVPDLKGKSLAAALDMVSPLNMGLRKDAVEFDSRVPISSIVRQEPPPGTVVREGKIVKVVVSQGGETVLTPSLVGLPLRNAELLLRQAQLLLGEMSEAYSVRQEKGIVLSQDPRPEASVERNSLVNVVVSGGPAPEGVLLMPDFLRKGVGEAQEWATENQVSISVAKDMGSLFANGVILSQSPAPDAVLGSGSKVSFVVSGREKQGSEGVAPRTFSYELPKGGSQSLVRIVVVDKYGERELFNGLRKPGTRIDLPLQETGGARLKIFLNGILAEERDL